MGFFKKLGKGLKGVTKMVSIKNVKKLASGDYQSVVREAQDRVAGIVKNVVTDEIKGGVKKLTTKKSTPTKVAVPATNKGEIKDVLLAGLSGALTGAGLQLTNNQDVAQQTANAADNVAMAWLKKNWLKALGVIAGVTVVVVVLAKTLGGSKSSTKRKV